jgi:hypothetical protein
MHEHQTHDGKIARGAEARPEPCHFIDRERNDGESRFPDAQSAQIEPGSAEAKRPAMQVDLMKAWRSLTGSIGELVPDSAIGASYTSLMVEADGGGCRLDWKRM